MQKDDDEDWTDADFVNDISERDQRFGKQKTTLEEAKLSTYANDAVMADLRKNVMQSHESGLKNYDRRAAYQTPGVNQTTK